jgi:hypothetical protein
MSLLTECETMKGFLTTENTDVHGMARWANIFLTAMAQMFADGVLVL